MYKSKSILTLHDLSFLRHREFFSWRKNFWHYSVNIKKLVSRVDTLVAVSEHTKRDAIELLGVKEKKIKVIYSGVADYSNMDQEFKNKIKIKYKLPDNFIFSLSTIEPRKNIDGLIKAFDLFCDKNKNIDCKLVIAGAWGWKIADVQNAYNESKNKKQIIFLGKISENDKPYIYSLAKIFVYPSFYEGFGFPPLEALFSGLRVVTSFSSSLPEISKNSFILVNPYDLNSIVSGIQKAVKGQDIKDSSFENTKKILNWDNTASAYLRLFEKLK